ncbi:MAG: GNAT family N-acetyltransferase, partial [Deltaproteobacteria bacterium]|nr:GNAT family N-acetyltransferase [Deltaproteobacteria bacterium]
SFVISDGSGAILGAAIVGRRGHRATLAHVGVDGSARHRYLGKELVRTVVDALAGTGIHVVHVVVTEGNPAVHFWRKVGFHDREDKRTFEADIPDHVDAPELPRDVVIERLSQDNLEQAFRDLPELATYAATRPISDCTDSHLLIRRGDDGERVLGCIIAGGLGVRGNILRIFVSPDVADPHDARVALIESVFRDLSDEGIYRVHAFPKRSDEATIEALESAGFRPIDRETYLERRLQ